MISALNLAPFHGLWKQGQITLPNGQQKTYPMPSGNVTELFGNSRLVRVPGLAVPNRNPAEQAADLAAGREWRNYALLAGYEPVYAGTGISRTAPTFGPTDGCWLYVDPMLNVWRIRCFANWTGGSTDAASGSIEVRRFGRFDGQAHAASSVPFSGVGIEGSPPFEYSDAPFRFLNANSRGSEAWLATLFAWDSINNSQSWPLLIMRVRVSGVGNEALAGAGLSFDVTLFGSRRVDIPTNLSPQEVSAYGGIQYLWPSYDANDTLSWLTFQRRQLDDYTLIAGFALGGGVLWGSQSTWNGVVGNDYRMLPSGSGAVPDITLPMAGIAPNLPSWYRFGFWNAARWDGTRWKMVYPVRYSGNVFGIVSGTASAGSVPTSISEGLTPEGAFTVWDSILTGSVRLENAVSAGGQSATYDVAAPSDAMRPTLLSGSNPDDWNAVTGRFATWQPVTQQLVVDTVPVCWV